MELISREKLKETIEPMVGRFDDEGDFYWSRESILRVIDNAPTIEERKEGRWEHPHDDEVKCSMCGYLTNWIEEPDIHGMGLAIYGEKYANFCPNCGAYMKGE